LRYLETRSPGQSDRRAVIGAPETVRAGLEEVAAEYGAEEVLVLTITHDHGERRRSYELIAEAFGLGDPHYAVRHSDQPRPHDRQRGPALAGEGPDGHELR
jgi:hypothetical protein